VNWDHRDLDFERAWRGGALLPPRPSGEHPLVCAIRSHTLKRGDLVDGAKRTTTKERKAAAPNYYKQLAARDVRRQKEGRVQRRHV
jgi:hypothetical protein